MRRRAPLLPLAAVLLTACAGAKLRAQKDQIADLQSKNAALTSALSQRSAELDAAKTAGAAAQAKASEAEAKLADAEGKLAIAGGRVDTLTKSNKDLTDAAGASSTELGGKLDAAIAEKDELAKKLAEAQQKELAASRLKSIYRSARDKAAADLASCESRRAELETRVQGFEAARSSETARAAALKAKLHDDMGSVADVILPDIQAGRAFAAVAGNAVVIKLSDALLFDGDTAKLTDAGAAALEKVGRALKSLGPRLIRVEAHNDAAPLKRGLLGGYEDHWELSAAQAASAARALSERGRVEPARMSAVADAQYHPFPTGDDGCADNRCVVISAEQVLTE
ncbi:MAG TPA: OmpA family protein [Elusimicrobiota bacterium]|nr:OmpA family protein [Elusimicrobiota bacterium]